MVRWCSENDIDNDSDYDCDSVDTVVSRWVEELSKLDIERGSSKVKGMEVQSSLFCNSFLQQQKLRLARSRNMVELRHIL